MKIMRRASGCLTTCALFFLFSCGGEEMPAPGEEEQFSEPQVSEPEFSEPFLSESNVGTLEQALTSPVWTFNAILRRCGSCSSVCVCGGDLYQNYVGKPCAPLGATKNVCWNYRCGMGQIAYLFQLVCK